ncbi:hypothetical protein CAL29_28080 [Bordetella genomosp. 10]|uniref:Phage tail protein n=2 Tax=Bordetella genomosp. 10 TaxID=1416804 RepID=A0A261S305_9BORD|nr:hypothetical protein CAL29_28080 [Bordetella genomosp. 10]
MTPAAFEALSFTQVRGVRTSGSLTRQFQTVTFSPLAGGRPRQRRVGWALLSLQLDLYRLNDTGQALLRAAVDQDAPYSFRIVVPGLGAHYFTARVSSRALGLGGATDLALSTVALEVESDVLEPI